MKMSNTSLANLCRVVKDPVDPRTRPNDRYLGLAHISPGRLFRTGAGRGSEVRSSKSRFIPGDVLYGKLRPYLDKAVLVDEEGICTTELLVLRAKLGVDPRFLAAVLHSPIFIEFSVAGTTGVQHPRTSWAHIRQFSLPEFTRDEQKRIGDLTWLVHESIEKSEQMIEESQALKFAAMQNLFTRGLRGEALKETEIGPLPESWGVMRLGALGKVGNGSTPKKGNLEYWTDGTYPWLTSAKVYDRDIVEADHFVTKRALNECHLPRVGPGAILIAITGQGKTLGHCAVLRIESTINQHLAYVALDQNKVDSVFVRSYLETKYDYLRQVAAGGGSTKGALTCGFLRNFPIPMPSLHEQREIVAILDSIEHKIDLNQRKSAALGDLFKVFMHMLIKGEIRLAKLQQLAIANSSAKL